MKKTVLYYIALPALLAAGCARMDPDESAGKKVVFQATVEAPVRSTASQDGRFAWSAGDRIGVQNAFGNFVEFNLTEGAGTATATFAYENEGGAPFHAGNWAVFLPNADYSSSWYSSVQIQDDGTLTVNMPSWYEWEEGETHSPMVAAIESGSGNRLSFKHLAGLIRFTVSSIPEGADSFVLMADHRKLSGSFPVSNGVIETEQTDRDERIVISLNNVPRNGNVTFHIPVPVGDYEGLTVGFAYYSDEFMGGGYKWRIDTPIHIDRADLREASHEFSLTWQETAFGAFSYNGFWSELYFDTSEYTNFRIAVLSKASFESTYGGDIARLADAEDSPFGNVKHGSHSFTYLDEDEMEMNVDYVAFAAKTDDNGLFTGDYCKAVFSLGWAYRAEGYSRSGSYLLCTPEGKLAKTMTSTQESGFLGKADVTMDNDVLVLTTEATDLFGFEGGWYSDPDQGEGSFYLFKIRLSDGRLLTSRENSAQLFAVAGNSALADSQLWEVELQENSTFVIRNCETARYLQYNAVDGVFGLYDTPTGSLPFLLYPDGTGSIGIQNY